MTGAAAPERDLIRRTARRIAIQTAALLAACLLTLAALTAFLIVRAQDADGQRQLRAAVADDDAVTDPPSGILVYQSEAGIVRSSPQLDGQPIDAAALGAVQAGGPTTTGEVTAGGREYQLRTARRGNITVQAALDLTTRNSERHRLVGALLAAGAAGLVIAVAIGSYIARRAVRPLELAIQRQLRFVADASHELRTPLTQAHTRAQMLQRSLAKLRTEPALIDEAGRMVDSTRQLGDIIEELLLSAQLGADPTVVMPVDLATVAGEVVDAEQARAHESGVTITVAHDGGPHTVPGSPTALRRVLNALVDNALGHVDAGGHVRVTVERDGSDRATVVCTVADDGHGFDPRDANALFARFARGNHGNARRFGLGLALAREVIHAHHGTITATSVPGHGATFTVVVPAYRH